MSDVKVNVGSDIHEMGTLLVAADSVEISADRFVADAAMRIFVQYRAQYPTGGAGSLAACAMADACSLYGAFVRERERLGSFDVPKNDIDPAKS